MRVKTPQPNIDVARDGRLTDELIVWLADGNEPEYGKLVYLHVMAKELKKVRGL